MLWVFAQSSSPMPSPMLPPTPAMPPRTWKTFESASRPRLRCTKCSPKKRLAQLISASASKCGSLGRRSCTTVVSHISNQSNKNNTPTPTVCNTSSESHAHLFGLPLLTRTTHRHSLDKPGTAERPARSGLPQNHYLQESFVAVAHLQSLRRR